MAHTCTAARDAASGISLHVVHVCVNYGDIVFPDKGSVLCSHHTSFLSAIFRVLGRVDHILRMYIHMYRHQVHNNIAV